MAHFFATPDDLLSVLLSVEAQHPVVYTLYGNAKASRVDHFTTARDLPTLFQPQPYESAICGPMYLVTEAGTDVVLRYFRLNSGEDRWAVDQLANPDSTVLRHGGFYGDKVLLEGDVGTAYKTKAARRLQRAFDDAIQEHFLKIDAHYYVGPGAEALLDSGYRLTADARGSPEYDLHRPSRPPGRSAAEAVHTRQSLEDTWRYLEAERSQAPRHPDGRPFVPSRMPSFDDDRPFGIRYFKSGLEDADRSHLTMPRTFFGRSGLVRVNFADTDLSESCMCWNDFDDCDFSGADLSGCDMRASIFTGCKFIGAVLRAADLRCSTFTDCDFAGADLRLAIADRAQTGGYLADKLTTGQLASVAWRDDPGEEPPGG